MTTVIQSPLVPMVKRIKKFELPMQKAHLFPAQRDPSTSTFYAIAVKVYATNDRFWKMLFSYPAL